MFAEIITIGDEILVGQTVDTNSAWMGEKLNELGVEVLQVRSIRDVDTAIVNALDSLDPRSKLVLITGGLGPTKDDLTKYTLQKYFGGDWVRVPEAEENVRRLFAALGREPQQVNLDQAVLPTSCKPLINKMGTASGMWFDKNGVAVISMPGVPYEMKSLMSDYILPWAAQQLKDQNIIHHTLLTQGQGESIIAERISHIEDSLPTELSLAYLPSPGMVKLRLTARGSNRSQLESAVSQYAGQIKTELKDILFGEKADRLEQLIGIQLKNAGATLSTAESCTGGYIASKITSVPGSSSYFLGSVVAYDNEIKKNWLGVPAGDIEAHGAVSEQVVVAMAEGVKEKMGTTFSIATSGVAGPDGGTAEKPVGTVWIAVSGPEGTLAKKFQFGSHRERNIKKSGLMALDILRKMLTK
ncbi:MAG: CinA family nicotinamide mononucleotide deamidase-related protein [Schleiferiaceae bacterium]